MKAMHTIGLTGGSSLCEIGSPTDVKKFFECLRLYAAAKYSEQDWRLLTDRLYKRYLRFDELAPASILMNQVRDTFVALPTASIDWGIGVGPGSRLDLNQITLAEVFAKYFESFFHCAESAKINYEGFKSFPGYTYEGVRLVISDQPWFMTEKMRSLDDYDALEGDPFWAR